MIGDPNEGHGPGRGRYLASVAERDIDLLLMEEFHANPAFVAWFCSCLGIEGIAPDGAWHSVSDADGETDLLLRVRNGEARIAILIENKIAAREQDGQASRYHVRARRAMERRHFDQYFTAMCAPARYLEGISQTSGYDVRIPYEKIADWFSGQGDSRSAWRHQVMREAIEQGRRGYAMIVNAAVTAFQEAYWSHLRVKHPRLLMAKPTSKGSNSNWIILKALGFPKGVQLHHKLAQGVVELGFQRTRVEEILAVQPEQPQGIVLVQKGATAALAVEVPLVEVTREFDAQVSSVEAGLQAAYQLMPFASLLANRQPQRNRAEL